MMPSMSLLRRSILVWAVFVSHAYFGQAHAQGVVGEKGSLTGSLSHDYGFADTIIETGGAEYPSTYVYTQQTTLGLEYVPLSRLALSVAVPLVGTKYDAEKSGAEYLPHGKYDDGSYHFTLQDLRADARYMVLGGTHALSLSAGITVPMADYAVTGSAASGRHLVQGRFGIATSISPSFLPRSFLNIGYQLTLSEKFDYSADTEKFSQTRSDASVNAGYFVRDDLGIFVLGAFRTQHDGIDFVDYDMLTEDQKDYHDPILREMALLLGLGAMYEINEKLYVTAAYSHFITGRNTLTSNALSVSIGWNILR